MTRRRFARKWWVGWVAMVVCLALPGLLFAQAQRKPQTPAPKTAPAKPAEPAKKPEAAKEAAPAAAERDPFEPLVVKTAPGETSAIQVTSLRLVGVLWDAARRDVRALVQTPDGLGYYLRVNEEKFGGRVTAIEPDRVRFTIREQDPGGQVRTRTVELKLGSQ
ncbi:MAG: hypothetical protein HYV62_05010 [Candidatus Rokubacteria bacterium]|nr:hypothetical protein [Candidatus Rokubacteria bacterium]